MESFISHFFIEIIIALQGIVPGILGYKLITHHYSKKIIFIYFVLVTWFVLMKYNLIELNSGTLIEYLSWGVYNIGIFILFIWIINDINNYKTAIKTLKEKIHNLEKKLNIK